MKKLPVPYVKLGKHKQLFFLNFNIDGKTISDNDEVLMLKNSMKIEIKKLERKSFIYIAREVFSNLKIYQTFIIQKMY